jgi:uncharacterized protein (DUF488 family)
MDEPSEAPAMYTVGHSTRTLDELVALLEQAGVRELVDVRSRPGSRRHPHFAGAALARSLPARDVAYRHEPRLGGFRRPQAGSPNGGWEHEAFRGYADYTASPDFREALDLLQRGARRRSTCVMCAEAQWWRCHRRLIADALVVSGWRVLHLGLGSPPLAHELTPFAVVGTDGRITYPPRQAELDLGRVTKGTP